MQWFARLPLGQRASLLPYFRGNPIWQHNALCNGLLIGYLWARGPPFFPALEATLFGSIMHYAMVCSLVTFGPGGLRSSPLSRQPYVFGTEWFAHWSPLGRGCPLLPCLTLYLRNGTLHSSDLDHSPFVGLFEHTCAYL